MRMNFLKDWIIQYQNKFSVGGVETTIDRVTGTVSQEGDTISAAYLNEIQKNCIYQVNATRVIEGVLEIYDITIDGSEEFAPFNQTFLIDFDSTNTQVDSLLRFNGNTYSLRFSDSISNGDISPKIGDIQKRGLVKLDATNSKAIIFDVKPSILHDPTFTGTPKAPTGTTGVSSEQIATQENVLNNIKSNKQTAKAWVNFNGTGTVAIMSSYNVSSITDKGTGTYTVNMTQSLNGLNYATFVTIGGARGKSDFRLYDDVIPKTINSFSFVTIDDTGTTSDAPIINTVVFGN